MVVLRIGVFAAAVLAASPSAAHVSVQPTTAAGGSYQVFRFGLGHGCDAKATTALRIEIPAGVATARPQPKPGWTLRIERPPGQADAVSAITWRGALPPDQFEEFVVLTKLPPGDGSPLPFPATQSCGTTQVRWVEVTRPGAARSEHPAPTVTLVPAAPPPEGAHEHHH